LIDFVVPAIVTRAQNSSLGIRLACDGHGCGEGRRRTKHGFEQSIFAHALDVVCTQLAGQIVADGEGATVVAEIGVTGAASTAEAKAIARRIATSPLVKTALHGRDANWGRVLAAAGSAPFNGGYAHLDPARVTLDFDGVRVLEHGAPRGVEPELTGETVTIALDLGLGAGHATYLTSDLSSDYVRINADYRS